MTNSDFKKTARQHQIEYRKKYISLDYNQYETWLSDADGQKGRNFYAGLGVFESVRQRYPQFYVKLYSDMLRSEHIPFNLFVPFLQNLEFCRNVFNEIMGDCVKSIENIKIEWAPFPKENYLDDGTSFDVYIEYTHIDNSKGIIGIEVKYTEKESLLSGKIRKAAINLFKQLIVNISFFSRSKVSPYISGNKEGVEYFSFSFISCNQLPSGSSRKR